MSKGISDTLRIGSFICTILIISIHYNSKSLIPITDGYGVNYYLQEFITGAAARTAVPYFALLSGYFASRSWQKGNGYDHFLRKKARTLLVPYLIAAYFIFYSSSLIEILINDGNALSINQILSYSKGVWTHPSEQLWYLRDLLFLTAAVPLLIHPHKYLLYVIAAIFGILWFFEKQIFPVVQGWYLLNMETLFFFTLGGIVYRIGPWPFWFFLKRIPLLFLIPLWMALTVLRIRIKPDFFVWYSDDYTLLSLVLYKSAILVGIPIIIALSFRLRKRKLLLYLSGLNFFVFLYHFSPLFYFRSLTNQIFPKGMNFYTDFPLASLVTYGTGLCLLRSAPRLFGLITGSRIPEKRRS